MVAAKYWLFRTPLEIVLYDDMNYLKAVEGPRLLLNETECEPRLGLYSGSKEGFSMWQQTLDPLYYQRSLKERFQVAMSLVYGWNGPEILRLALALGPLPPLAHCMTDRYGETLLHAVAWGMGHPMDLRPEDFPREKYEMDAIGMNPK